MNFASIENRRLHVRTKHALALLVTLAATLTLGWTGGLARPSTDYFPVEMLDRPLGVERLPNGNTLITDAGGAFYTNTDDSIMEIGPGGELVWQYVGDMTFPHSAERLPNGDTLISDTTNNRVFQVNQTGEIVWSSDDWSGGTGQLDDGSHLHYPNDVEALENGRLLITDRNNDRVLEVDRQGHVAWQYAQLDRPHNGDRLPNGNTLVVNSEADLIVELNPAGEVVWSFGESGLLRWPRDADRLANGNTLITDTRHNRVLEVNPAGRVVWSFSGLALPYEADRLANGNTLIGDNNHKRVIEVDAQGQIVWSFRNYEVAYSAELENGGFEEGGDLPRGWYPADMNAEGDGEFVWDTNVKHRGQRSASARYQGEGRISWLQTLAVQPDTEYTFSGYVKTQLQDGVVAYQLWFEDELGGPMGDPITVAPHQGVTDWTRDSLTIRPPEGAVAVQIWCQVIADGQAWFDDVSWGEKKAGSNLTWVIAAAVALVVIVLGSLIWRKRSTK
jgi:hypothetical protein